LLATKSSLVNNLSLCKKLKSFQLLPKWGFFYVSHFHQWINVDWSSPIDIDMSSWISEIRNMEMIEMLNMNMLSFNSGKSGIGFKCDS
jgi:hypothetical protein